MLNMDFLHFSQIFVDVAYLMLLRNNRAHEILKNFVKNAKNLAQNGEKTHYSGTYAQKSNFGHLICHYSPLSLVKTV